MGTDQGGMRPQEGQGVHSQTEENAHGNGIPIGTYVPHWLSVVFLTPCLC